MNYLQLLSTMILGLDFYKIIMCENDYIMEMDRVTELKLLEPGKNRV